MTKGYIYIMTNPSFPDYVKIGYAEDAKKRLKEANDSTWTPFAFRLYATYEVNKYKADTDIHEIITIANPELRAVDNIDGKIRKREFFKISPENAYRILEKLASVSGTEDKLWKNSEWTIEDKEADIEASNAKEEVFERKGAFSFDKAGINVGEKVYFKYDQSIYAEVANGNKVKYQGKTYSLSGLALKLINQMPGYHWKSAQGSAFFTYNGVLLSDVREGKSEIYQGSKGTPKTGSLFSKYGLKDGDKLEFIRHKGLDLIVDDNKVVFESKHYSLSALAKLLLERYCNLSWKSVQGPQYFAYNGTVLKDIEESHKQNQ